MSGSDRRPRGWASWALLTASLLAFPLNGFLILFWSWAATHHAVETAREDAITLAALGVLIALVAATITAIVRRWRVALAVLAAIQIVPALVVLAFLVFGV